MKMIFLNFLCSRSKESPSSGTIYSDDNNFLAFSNVGMKLSYMVITVCDCVCVLYSPGGFVAKSFMRYYVNTFLFYSSCKPHFYRLYERRGMRIFFGMGQ